MARIGILDANRRLYPEIRIKVEPVIEVADNGAVQQADRPGACKGDEWWNAKLRGGERICACGGEQVIERLIDGEKIKLGSHISRKSCIEISRVGTHRRARNSGAQVSHARTHKRLIY